LARSRKAVTSENVWMSPTTSDDAGITTRIIEGAAACVRAALSIGCWAFFIVMTVQVASRYLFNSSISWGEELGRYLMVWVGFLASVELVRTNSLTAFEPGAAEPEGLEGALHPRRQPTGKLVGTIAFFTVVAISGALLVQLGRSQDSVALGLPMSVVYGVIPVSAIAAALVGLSLLIRQHSGARRE
jgi:TRAP-type transport system small permease protein